MIRHKTLQYIPLGKKRIAEMTRVRRDLFMKGIFGGLKLNSKFF